MTRQEEIMQKSAYAKKTGFDEWMKNPMTRALLSTIPALENKETLQALLQACFDSGYGSGVASVILDIIENTFKKKDM